MTYAMPLQAARPLASAFTPTSFATDVAYDWVAVDLAMRGELTPRYTADREEVVRRLNQQGLTDVEIADRTGITSRTVLRIRKRLHLDTALPFGHTTRTVLR